MIDSEESKLDIDAIEDVTSGQVAIEPIAKSSDDHVNIGEIAASQPISSVMEKNPVI